MSDPFEIIGEIPEGRVYQWWAEKIHGVPSFFLPKLGRDWTPVPASRHPQMPADDSERICIGDQVLVECSREHWEQEQKRQRERVKALTAHDPVSPSSFGGHHDEESFQKCVDVLREEYKHRGEKIPVTIYVELTDREIEAAAICNMSLEKYAQTKICYIKSVFFPQVAYLRADDRIPPRYSFYAM